MQTLEALAAGLLAHLRRHLPETTSIDALTPITTGASQELWTFTARVADDAFPLVLRRMRRWSDTSQAASVGMKAEAALLRLAAEAGIPVPRVRTELASEDGLGAGYVMERVEGESSGRRIVRDAARDGARSHLLTDCAAILARIHAMPIDRLPELRTGQAADELRHWEAAYRDNDVARPVFALAFRWLRRHRPEPVVAPVLVHGDFRNGNLLVGPGGVRAVLDWELAHLGDPMEDLGWFCVNAWRYGNVELPAGGFGSREALFDAYEAAGGRSVDPRRAHYWEVLGNLKWGIACDAMGLAWRSGRDRSIERLAIARRATEVEVDLLQLLAPGAAS